MNNPIDTNQANEDALTYGVDLGIPGGDFIALSIKKGSTLFTFTGDEAVATIDLIRTEKLKLLAEVRERVEHSLPDTTFLGTSIRVKDNIRDDGYHDGVIDSRLSIEEELTKLEAEL